MKKVLVHVHIFYPEFWEELKAHIQNMAPNPYDLYVTLVQENQVLQSDIMAFNPAAQIQIVENKGFDVAGFLSVLNQVNLDDYDFIVKLHSKRNLLKGNLLKINRFLTLDVGEEKWRQYLLDFIHTPEHFAACLAAFQQDPQLGMTANFKMIRRSFDKFDLMQIPVMTKILSAMNLQFTSDLAYVTGTMFMARASLFKVLQQMSLGSNDFEISDKNTKVSLAHALERVMGMMITSQGYRVEDAYTSEDTVKHEKLVMYLKMLERFIYTNKMTSKNKKVIKILGMRLYSKKLN